LVNELKIMFIFVGQKKHLHLAANTAGMCNKTDKLMWIYGQYSTYLGIRGQAQKKENEHLNLKNNIL